MVNKLEKTFFDTFGIEPRLDCKRCGAMNFALGQCAEVNCEKAYPKITDHILLELICLINRELILVTKIRGKDLEELKHNILEKCIEDYNIYANSSFPSNTEVASNFKRQVRTLFEE